MAVNAEWTLWVIASVSQHFQAKATTKGITMFHEGDDRNTQNLEEFVEFRCQGPFITQQSLDCFRLEVEVQMLISVKKGGTNVYRIHEIAGWFQSIALHICIYDKGVTREEYTHQFDLLPQDGPKGKVRWHYLGQVEPNINLLQGVLVANYDVELTA